MKSFNSPPLLVLCALLGVAVAAAPAHAQHLRLELTNADFYSVLLRNASGQEHGPGSGFFPGLGENEIPGVSFSVASEASIDFVLPSGASFELDFAGKGQPVEVRLRSLDGSDHVTRVVRWEGVAVPAGAAGILELDAAGGGVLRVAPVAGGVANTVVPASVDVSGAAAGDQTPPEIVHQRAFNGQHTLQLLDGGVDITGEGRLYVSLDGGQGYEAYTAPMQIDSRETPTLYAIGSDRLGNTSSLQAISTVADFCTRVADDRMALQGVARDGLARTLADGLLPADPGVALLVHGDAACLFRREAGGADASCAACQGIYAPGHSEVGLAVLFPDGTPAATQGALIGHLEAVASEQSTLEAVRASAESRSAFETGSVDLAPGSDFGLARQLRSLEWALAGEYVEALPGMPGVSGLPLGDVADALQAAGGIPSMDGHEAARLGEWEMLKSGVMLRIADLAQGAVPTEPERDRFENRTLRRQLEAAADARVRASLGALAADSCAAGNGLVSVSRASFRGTACAGAACRSFAEWVAAQVLESRTVCPFLFSDEAILGLAESVELAQADATLLARVFGDECEANALLASALLELGALAESTRPSYEAGLAASSLAERNQRVQNLQDLDAARLARLSPATQRLRLMVANPTEQAIGGARLRMYEDGVANGQVRDLEVPARTRRILEGDPAIGLPFYLERDVQTQPNEIHHVVFQLEEGGGTAAPVGDRTFAGYDYYVFDPSQVICPVQTPPVAPQPGATVP